MSFKSSALFNLSTNVKEPPTPFLAVLINSSRGTEIAALGVKNGITEFLPQVAKDIFLF